MSEAEELKRVKMRLETAVLLLDQLVDKRLCEYDRHGECEVHHWDQPCPHELARMFVAGNSTANDAKAANLNYGAAESVVCFVLPVELVAKLGEYAAVHTGGSVGELCREFVLERVAPQLSVLGRES